MTDEDRMELRAAMARWEALRVRWALNGEEEAALLGGTGFQGPVDDARSWQASRMEHRIRLLVELGAGLDVLFDDERRVRAWLRRSMETLGGCRPLDAMASSIDMIRALRRTVRDFTR